MYDIVIERSYYPGGTNGSLSYQGKEICKTIELPWLDNKPFVSCIPEGTYTALLRETHKYGMHLWITGVPTRIGVLMHPANDAETDLKGCIAPVMNITGEGKGAFSKMAMKKLMKIIYFDLLHGNPVNLIIKSKYPGHEKEYNDLSGTANQWAAGQQ